MNHPHLRKPIQMAHYHKRPTVVQVIGWLLSMLVILVTCYAIASGTIVP